MLGWQTDKKVSMCAAGEVSGVCVSVSVSVSAALPVCMFLNGMFLNVMEWLLVVSVKIYEGSLVLMKKQF